MTIAISIDKALDSVYAYTALESLARPDAPLPGRDQAPALRVVAREMLAGIVRRMGRAVSRADFESDPDIVTLEFDVDASSGAVATIGPLLCSSLCSGILSRVFPNCAAAAGCNDTELSTLLGSLASIAPYRV